MPKAGFAEWDEDERFDVYDERPFRRGRRKRLPWLRLILLSSLSVAGLVYFAQHRDQERKPAGRRGVPASVLIAPAPIWKPVVPSPAVYTLEKSLGPVAQEARQHTSGAREDTLILGSFGDARHARITLVQGSPEPARSFFVDIVRRAAGAGLAVARNTQSRMVATKFGPIEVASMTLSGPVEQECQAFRFFQRNADFGFQGWLCGSEGKPVEETQLACFIDGLALAGGANLSLKALFARAEKQRSAPCPPPARIASTQRG
jgi:hypothetical protein